MGVAETIEEARKRFFCQPEVKQIDLLQEILETDTTREKLASCQTKLAESQAQNAMQNLDDNSFFLPDATRKILAAYDTKYPEAKVQYAGRNVPNDTSRGNYSIAVQNFSQAGVGTPEMLSIVDAAKANVFNIMKETGVSFHEACDISFARIKVYTSIIGPYKYSYDSSTTTQNEFFKFAIETWVSITKFGIGSDCDDWAILQQVLCLTAGIPRSMLRIAAGLTNDGQGHATNHYFASDLKWHHCNSTTPYKSFFDVKKLPLHDDKTEPLGIRSVWFSFNDKHAWSQGIPTLDSGKKKPKRMPNILKDINITKI